MSKDKYYSIGKTSELTNISIPTLRYYDNIGLLIPKVRKSDSKYRYYTDDQLVTAFLIRRLRILNFSLKEIKEITSKNSADTLEEFFLQKEADSERPRIQAAKNRTGSSDPSVQRAGGHSFLP